MTEPTDPPPDQHAVEPVDPELPFAAAIEELEAILGELEGDDVDIDRLAGNVRRASELLAMCRQRIAGVEMEISQILES